MRLMVQRRIDLVDLMLNLFLHILQVANIELLMLFITEILKEMSQIMIGMAFILTTQYVVALHLLEMVNGQLQ